MNLFNIFKKKKNEKVEPIQVIETEKEVINYGDLVEIAGILTENNEEAMNTIQLLVNEPLHFSNLYEEWLYEYDFSPEHQPDIITAFLLTGYNVDSPYDFGAYVDWKEDGQEIILSLKEGIKNKNYTINLENSLLPEKTCGYEAIKKIATFLNRINYSLIIWDIGGDCYNLFIIPKSKWTTLQRLGNKMEILFQEVV